MGKFRKHIPDPVQWDQQAILAAIAAISSAFSTLNSLTGNPVTDARGTVVRNVRDHEIISALVAIPEVLERIHTQLTFLTDVDLNAGDG